MPTEVKTFGDILRDGAAALPSYLKPPVNGDGQLDPTHPTSQAVVQLVNTIRSSIDITEIKVARKWTRIGNSVFVFDENDSFLVDQCMVELDGHINLSALKVHDGTRMCNIENEFSSKHKNISIPDGLRPPPQLRGTLDPPITSIPRYNTILPDNESTSMIADTPPVESLEASQSNIDETVVNTGGPLSGPTGDLALRSQSVAERGRIEGPCPNQSIDGDSEQGTEESSSSSLCETSSPGLWLCALRTPVTELDGEPVKTEYRVATMTGAVEVHELLSHPRSGRKVATLAAYFQGLMYLSGAHEYCGTWLGLATVNARFGRILLWERGTSEDSVEDIGTTSSLNAGLAITPTLDVLADAESAPLFFLIEVSKEFQARHARTMSIQEFLGLEDIHSALPHDLSLSYDEDGRPHLGNDGYAFLNPDAVHTIWAFFNTALSLVRDMPFDPPLSRLKSPTSNATEYVMELFNDKVAVRMLVDEENLTDLAKAGRKIVDDSTPDGSCDGSIWTREDCSGPSSALKATSSSWNESEFTEWRNHVVLQDSQPDFMGHEEDTIGISDDARCSDSDLKESEDEEQVAFIERYKAAIVLLVNKAEMDCSVFLRLKTS